MPVSSGGSPAAAVARTVVSYIFEALARYDTWTAGGGTVTLINGGFRINTNAGNNNGGGIGSQFPSDFPVFDKKPSFAINLGNLTSVAGSGYQAFGMINSGGASDTNPGNLTDGPQYQKGAWIVKKVTAGVVTWWAVTSNGDGTNWTATEFDMTSDTGSHQFFIEFTDEGVKFYADGELKATNTTNIPTGNASNGQLLWIQERNASGDSTGRILDVQAANIAFEA